MAFTNHPLFGESDREEQHTDRIILRLWFVAFFICSIFLSVQAAEISTLCGEIYKRE